jgi:hypothetical protein
MSSELKLFILLRQRIGNSIISHGLFEFYFFTGMGTMVAFSGLQTKYLRQPTGGLSLFVGKDFNP